VPLPKWGTHVFDVQIPKMGMSTVEVEVVGVDASVGDRVAADTVLLSIEGDKAQFDVEAGTAGVVRELLVKEGDLCNVGDIVARIDPQA
jgi:pyruvate dehydrogenase E2 component (dihydrolipoamide acetyltransferase)